MTLSYLYVKTSRKSHARKLFAKWIGMWLLHGSYEVYLAVTGSTLAVVGSTWRFLEGCHVHLATATYICKLPCRPHNCHEIATSHSISRESKKYIYIIQWTQSKSDLWYFFTVAQTRTEHSVFIYVSERQ